MINLREDCREIFIGDSDPKGEYHPGKIADGCTEGENCRDREEIYKKNYGSEEDIFELMFYSHGRSAKTLGAFFSRAWDDRETRNYYYTTLAAKQRCFCRCHVFPDWPGFVSLCNGIIPVEVLLY
jgi:hypothetical protein